MNHKHRWQYTGAYLTTDGDRGLLARYKDALKFVCECGASKIVKEKKQEIEK